MQQQIQYYRMATLCEAMAVSLGGLLCLAIPVFNYAITELANLPIVIT